MKSEPEAYSLLDLERDRRALWSDIRNYQARNYMLAMKVGDLALFYHSNAAPSGVAGLMRVVGLGVPDPTQFDPANEHFERRATVDKPLWFAVRVEFVAHATHFLPLPEIRAQPRLQKMALFQQGSRLSITPVRPGEYKLIARLAGLPETA